MLDDPHVVLYALRDMQDAGARAHGAATEDEGLTGPVRDMLFGINSVIDALVSMVQDGDR